MPWQPLPPVAVYVIDAPPPATPVTTPEPLTVAIEALLLDHDPPPGEPERLRVLPTQTLVPPEIVTVGAGFTVTEIVFELTLQVPLETCR